MKKLLLLLLLSSSQLLCQSITSVGDYIQLRGDIIGEITSVDYREAKLTQELTPEDFHILTVMKPGYKFYFETPDNMYYLMKLYDSEVISWELTIEENRNLKKFNSIQREKKTFVNSGQNLIRAGIFKNLALASAPVAIFISNILNEASNQNAEVARLITNIGAAASVGFYIAGNTQLIKAGKELKQGDKTGPSIDKSLSNENERVITNLLDFRITGRYGTTRIEEFENGSIWIFAQNYGSNKEGEIIAFPIGNDRNDAIKTFEEILNTLTLAKGDNALSNGIEVTKKGARVITLKMVNKPTDGYTWLTKEQCEKAITKLKEQ